MEQKLEKQINQEAGLENSQAEQPLHVAPRKMIENATAGLDLSPHDLAHATRVITLAEKLSQLNSGLESEIQELIQKGIIFPAQRED
jgi:hypothetical protein